MSGLGAFDVGTFDEAVFDGNKVSESVLTSETSLSKSFAKKVFENLGVGDASNLSVDKLLSEAFNLSEEELEKGLGKAVSDDLSLSEDFRKDLNQFIQKAFSDSIIIDETFSKDLIQLFKKLFEEALSLSDDESHRLAQHFVKSVFDSVELGDSVSERVITIARMVYALLSVKRFNTRIKIKK